VTGAPAAASPTAGVPDPGVALPIAITRDGRLQTGDAREGLVALIGAMFASPRKHWPHAPWFGLYEVASAPRPDRLALADQLNQALRHLGVAWASVAEVQLAAGEGDGERRFAIVLAGPENDRWEERHEVPA
jgi:hypothetical protein